MSDNGRGRSIIKFQIVGYILDALTEQKSFGKIVRRWKQIKPCIQINNMILYYHQINLQAPGITLRCRRCAKLSVEDEISSQKHDAGGRWATSAVIALDDPSITKFQIAGTIQTKYIP